MSMDHAKLLDHCVRMLNTFNEEMVSLEEHVNQYLKKQKITDETDQAFIVEVFSGCIRYAMIMKVVVDGYYNKDGKMMLRSEQHLYTVLSYLALFRLDELGMAHYRKFIQNQDLRKMIKFFTFFLNDYYLVSWMKDEWEKDYEQEFVHTTIVAPFQGWLPELLDMLKMLNKKMENEKMPKISTQSKTECQPFDITQPKPKSIPMPEPIPKLEKHKRVPKTAYRDPSEFDTLSKIKQKNRHQAEERLMESSRHQFACANPEKSHKTKEKLMNIVMSEEAKLEFDKKKALPKPAFLVKNKEVPVKLNAATILRDGIRYKKLEEREMEKYRRLEAGARDTSSFLEWQAEMRRRDLETQLADIERRHLLGKLSHEEAILAKQNVTAEKKKTVQAMKEETQKMMREYLEKKFQEEQEMKQLLENTMQGHKNAKEAKRKLQEYKQKIVQEVNEESRELMKRALEEAEADMRRKMELIQQIRAMEAVPVMRQKFVDLTATAGMGLLNEMSIAELRERLALLKVGNEEAEELKRDEILESKQNKDQLLLDTLETISKHRAEQMRAAAIRLEEKKKKRLHKPEVKDEKVQELQRQLEEKRQARIQAQLSSKVTPTPAALEQTRRLIRQKERLEESRWQELELSRERTAKLASQRMASSSTARKLTPPDSFVMAS